MAVRANDIAFRKLLSHDPQAANQRQFIRLVQFRFTLSVIEIHNVERVSPAAICTRLILLFLKVQPNRGALHSIPRQILSLVAPVVPLAIIPLSLRVRVAHSLYCSIELHAEI